MTQVNEISNSSIISLVKAAIVVIIMLSTCHVALAVLFLTTLIGDLTAEEPIAGKNTRCWCEQENGCRNAPETTGSNVEVKIVLFHV